MDKHPSALIDGSIVDLLRNLSAAAERNGMLHAQQLQVIYEQQWFKLFVPRIYGGMELDLPEALRLEEMLAWIDGSIGWTVTLCGGANWFVGYLQQEIAASIFTDKEVCLAGSGRPSGVARRIPAGYEISGRWKYATGAPHATVFTANCRIEENGVFIRDETGNEIVRSFWFHKSEVIIHNDWHCIGMTATASNSFEVRSLQVPFSRSFVIAPHKAVLAQPVYHFPFLPFAETTLAVNSSGMAIHFLDACKILFAQKEESNHYTEAVISSLHIRLHDATAELCRLRRSFFDTVATAWSQLLQHKTVDQHILDEVGRVSRELAREARRLVDELYPYCGLAAANPASEINRVWRDLHTASQHPLLVYGL